MGIRENKEKYNFYMKEYHIKHYYNKKATYLELLGGSCIKCGSIQNLEFDHIDPNTKTYTITSKILTYSKKKLLEELQKCQLLCKDCHTIKSIKEANKLSALNTHGTLSSYRYCHCNRCKEAKAIYMKNYKLNNRLISIDSDAVAL